MILQILLIQIKLWFCETEKMEIFLNLNIFKGFVSKKRIFWNPHKYFFSFLFHDFFAY